MTTSSRFNHPPGNGGSSSAHVPTGFDELDAQLGGGFQAGTLTLAVAPPSPLLAPFGLACARRAASHLLRPTSTVVFSQGTARASTLTHRLLAGEARVDFQRMRTGCLNDEDWHRLARAAGRLSGAPLFISEAPGRSAPELAAICRRLSAAREDAVPHDPLFVVVGPLCYPREAHETQGPQAASGSFHEDSAPQALSLRSLRQMARAHGMAVLALVPAKPEGPKESDLTDTDGFAELSELLKETIERVQEQAATPTTDLPGLRYMAEEHLRQADVALFLQYRERRRLVALDDPISQNDRSALAARDLVEVLVSRRNAGRLEREGPPFPLAFAPECERFDEVATCGR